MNTASWNSEHYLPFLFPNSIPLGRKRTLQLHFAIVGLQSLFSFLKLLDSAMNLNQSSFIGTETIVLYNVSAGSIALPLFLSLNLLFLQVFVVIPVVFASKGRWFWPPSQKFLWTNEPQGLESVAPRVITRTCYFNFLRSFNLHSTNEHSIVQGKQ